MTERKFIRTANKADKKHQDPAVEGDKKKNDASVKLQLEAYENVLKDLSKENFELRKEIWKRKGHQDSSTSSHIPAKVCKKKTLLSLDATKRKGVSVLSSSPPPPNTIMAAEEQDQGGRETTPTMKELIAVKQKPWGKEFSPELLIFLPGF